MLITLTKHEMGWFRRGPDPETGTIFLYRIEGLPDGEQASIGEFPYLGWRILRWKGGLPGVWHGEYETVDEAIAALEKQLEFEMALAADAGQVKDSTRDCNHAHLWLLGF